MFNKFCWTNVNGQQNDASRDEYLYLFNKLLNNSKKVFNKFCWTNTNMYWICWNMCLFNKTWTLLNNSRKVFNKKCSTNTKNNTGIVEQIHTFVLFVEQNIKKSPKVVSFVFCLTNFVFVEQFLLNKHKSQISNKYDKQWTMILDKFYTWGQNSAKM